MSIYAKDTEVSPERTMTEIRNTLRRYNASSIATLEGEQAIAIAFEMSNRRVRFDVPIPGLSEFLKTKTGVQRTPASAKASREKAIRQRWRALLLVVKAKLEAVESGIETFDDAFMAHLLLPNGQTLTQYATPQIQESYRSGKMPPLLGSGQ